MTHATPAFLRLCLCVCLFFTPCCPSQISPYAEQIMTLLDVSLRGHMGALFFLGFPKPNATLALMNEQCSGCILFTLPFTQLLVGSILSQTCIAAIFPYPAPRAGRCSVNARLLEYNFLFTYWAPSVHMTDKSVLNKCKALGAWLES